MACDAQIPKGMTLKERMAQIQAAIKRLEASLANGTVRPAIAPNGAVTFAGWKDRDGVNDACAYRALATQSSWALRQAIARAEAMSGRRVNAQAVAAGWHSHDGGTTWGKH